MTTTAKIHTERWQEPGVDRYQFDFDRCSLKNGWAQIDTSQDAWYFGQWANPLELRIMVYAEGDCTLMTASSKAEFVKEIRSMAEWNIKQGWGFGIDAGFRKTEIVDAFQSLGLGDLLH